MEAVLEAAKDEVFFQSLKFDDETVKLLSNTPWVTLFWYFN